MQEMEKELGFEVSEEKEQVRTKEDETGQENIEGARKNGWLTVLADQISRMVRAPLNRSYFRSSSERARLTRRKTFDECPVSLQEDSSLPFFPPPVFPRFLAARKIDPRITPGSLARLSSIHCLTMHTRLSQ